MGSNDQPAQASGLMVGSSPCVDLPWFTVLPDHDAGKNAAARLRAWARDEVRHHSGRPWLLGRWTHQELTLIGGRTRKVALVGHHGEDMPLRRAVERDAAIDEIAAAADRIDGRFHVVVSVPGTVTVRGTLVGLRAVYHTTVSQCAVAGDRADVLAALRGGYIDEERLAVQLLMPPSLPPVSDDTVWHGVSMVPPHDCLTIEGRAGARLRRRWSAPEPTLDLPDGAAELRRRLLSAVAVRTKRGGPVSCDLAGLDSTSICSIAARCGTKVVAITAANIDPTDDDMLWAERTLSGLDNVDHAVIAAEEMPLPYSCLLEPGERFDEPCPIEVNHRGVMAQVQRAAAAGSVLHLNGFGGDELLQGSLAHLHSMVRSSPRKALSRLRVFKTAHRWSTRQTMRLLLGRHSYRAWLDQTAAQLTGTPLTSAAPLLDWSVPPQLPPWVTQEAQDVLRRRIEAAAVVAEPLAPDRGRHLDLQALRAGARCARQYDQLARRVGVPIAAPFYDDAVVDAGLAVSPEVRVNPWRYKPLIVEAMRGIVPKATLARTTKAHWTQAQQAGLQAHRHHIAALAECSALDRLGLIDGHVLRSFCSRPLPPSMHPGVFDQTVACERWLRAVLAIGETRSNLEW